MKIEIEWWNNELRRSNKEISKKHQSILKNAAIDHIFKQMKNKFIGGQLLHNINGIYYQGWWTLNDNPYGTTRFTTFQS